MKRENAGARSLKKKDARSKTGRAMKHVAPAPRGRRATRSDLFARAFTGPRAQEAVPKKWSWHYRVLLALQDRLLRNRGERLAAAAEALEPHSLDEADSATDEFDHDRALSQLSAEQDALLEVNAALRRILNGSYGVCEESGDAISAARLMAIPWTRFTGEVAARLEKKGVVQRTHLGKASTVRMSNQIWLKPEEEAEEAEEAPHVVPKDEALTHIFSPAPVPPDLSGNK